MISSALFGYLGCMLFAAAVLARCATRYRLSDAARIILVLGSAGLLLVPVGELMLVEYLRAVIGDVKSEINGFSQTAAEIAASSQDLSSRTESQASSLEETAASMEQLSSTVQQTADTARQVAQQGEKSSSVATRGNSCASSSRS